MARDVKPPGHAHSTARWRASLFCSGPVVISGFLGRRANEEPPTLLTYLLPGESVYAWKRGAKRREKSAVFGHVVVVTGCVLTATNKDLVLFSDPDDASDPAHERRRRTYAISYENLCANLVDNDGWAFDPEAVSPAGYG